jgi:hypothetical protein
MVHLMLGTSSETDHQLRLLLPFFAFFLTLVPPLTVVVALIFTAGGGVFVLMVGAVEYVILIGGAVVGLLAIVPFAATVHVLLSGYLL